MSLLAICCEAMAQHGARPSGPGHPWRCRRQPPAGTVGEWEMKWRKSHTGHNLTACSRRHDGEAELEAVQEVERMETLGAGVRGEVGDE